LQLSAIIDSASSFQEEFTIMPVYDYKCPECGHRFEARHGFNDTVPPCPACSFAEAQRVITSAPTVAGGVLTHAGDGHRASKEQLRDKWSEETPRLRKKLVDKLGEDTVRKNAPSLFMKHSGE
jgi:putative FmdB family regulatory protein